MTRENLISRIQKNIQTLSDLATNPTRKNVLSVTPRIESICATMLNLIYDFSFRTAETESMHHPTVDYADQTHGTALQIISTATKAKINRIVSSFLSQGLHSTYHTLIILTLTTGVAPSPDPSHEAEQVYLQILTLRDLVDLTAALPTDKLEKIADYLRQEIGAESAASAAIAHPGYMLPAAPAPVRSFGPESRRKELERIHYGLQSKDSLIFLSGEAGIGKTQLALRYAELYAPDKGAYLLPYQPHTNQSMPLRETILHALPSGYADLNKECNTPAEIYRRVLEELHRQYSGALLIIDGFDPNQSLVSITACTKGFRTFITRTNVKLIVTTRCTDLRTAQMVRPLTKEERKWLWSYHGLQTPPWNEAAFPLPLYSNTQFLDLYPRLISRMPSAKDHLTKNDASLQQAEASIVTYFSSIIQKLTEDCRSILSLAALLPEEGLEKAILEHALSAPRKQTLRSLLNGGWIEQNAPGPDITEDGRGLLSLHPWIRTACMELTPTPEDCNRFLDGIWDYEQSWRWDRIPLLEHANVKRRLAKTYAAAAKTLPDPAGKYAHRSAELWKSVDQIRDALIQQQQVIARLPEEAQWERARAYHFSSECLMQLRSYGKALDYRQKVLELCQDPLKASGPDLAAAHYHVGCALSALEQYPEAARQFELAREKRDFLSVSHPLRKALQEQLDHTYAKLGQHRIALEYLQQELNSTPNARYLWLPLPETVGMVSFLGRETELRAIHKQLCNGVRPIVISGKPGSGKTELAVQFARHYRQGQVFYARFRVDLAQTISSMAESIRPPLTPEESTLIQFDRCQLVLDLLRSCTDQDILIIDDVRFDDPREWHIEHSPVYRDLLSLPIRLIFTTNDEYPNSISVKQLPHEELMQIFELHGVQLEKERMIALIDAVNGKTEAVSVIAEIMANGGNIDMTDAQLSAALRGAQQAHPGRRSNGYYSTESAWSTHYLFDLVQLSDTGRAVLRCAALIPPPGIRETLFRESLPPYDRGGLSELLQRGWLQAEQGILTIPPAIRSVCLLELKLSDRYCIPFLNNLWSRYASRMYDPEAWEQMAGVFGQAAQDLDDWGAEQLIRASTLWRAVAKPRNAKELFDRLITKQERSLSGSDIRFAQIHNEAGLTFIDLGMYANALDYTMRAVAICENAPNGDPAIMADAYHNVGAAYTAMGNYAIALEYQEKALELYKALDKPDKTRIASAYCTLGNTYKILGDSAKALERYTSALDLGPEALPLEHPDLITIYRNIGAAHSDLGHHDRALEYGLKALDIQKKVLPPHHPDLALSCSNLAGSCYRMKQYEKALEYARQALQIAEHSLPEGHPRRIDYRRLFDRMTKESTQRKSGPLFLRSHPRPPK